MPQFDVAQALPQIVWLVLVFGALFLIVQALYPRVEKVVDDRQGRIASDLREAEAARDSAQSATSGSLSVLTEARNQALTLTGAARDQAAAATRARLAEAEAGLRQQGEAAAADLAGQRASVEAELDRVAAEAAAQLIERLSGMRISAEQAQAAIGKVAV